MIDIFIVEEMILQMRQNNLRKRLLEVRLDRETCFLRCEHFLEEIKQIDETNIEIEQMLMLEYEEGISTHQLLKDIKQ